MSGLHRDDNAKFNLQWRRLAYPDGNGDTNSYSYCDSYADGNLYAYSDGNVNGIAYCNGNAYCYCYCAAQDYPDAKAASYSVTTSVNSSV